MDLSQYAGVVTVITSRFVTGNTEKQDSQAEKWKKIKAKKLRQQLR